MLASASGVGRSTSGVARSCRNPAFGVLSRLPLLCQSLLRSRFSLFKHLLPLFAQDRSRRSRSGLLFGPAALGFPSSCGRSRCQLYAPLPIGALTVSVDDAATTLELQ